GIRDATVTGVQTCALPIWMIGMMLFRCIRQALFLGSAVLSAGGLWLVLELLVARPRPVTAEGICIHRIVPAYSFPSGHVMHDVRSEERREGKSVGVDLLAH